MATSPKSVDGAAVANAATRPGSGSGDRASGTSQPRSDRRSRVLLAPFGRGLPEDFLRISDSEGNQYVSERDQQIARDEQAALALQRQYDYAAQGMVASPMAQAAGIPNLRGRLDLTIVEARLVKNYGVTRMDPYVRLRIAHNIYETRTCYNGARNPRWNKVFHCFLPNGVDSFHLEIYDECAFSVDEKIAWCHKVIPERVFNGETVEEWISLSGRQGEGREGDICIVMSFVPIAQAASMMLQNAMPIGVPAPGVPGVVIRPGVGPAAPQVYVRPEPPPMPPGEQPATQPPPIVINEEDVKLIKEMFPSTDDEVIKTILENERGNKDRAINCLLQMNSE